MIIAALLWFIYFDNIFKKIFHKLRLYTQISNFCIAKLMGLLLGDLNMVPKQ